jgi:hypothetical protein
MKQSDAEIEFSMPEQIKLQVPMRRDIHDALKARAEELGFDSVQSYVRFWATAETAGSRPRPPQQTGLRPVAGPRTWAPAETLAPDTGTSAEMAKISPSGHRSLDHPDAQALRYLELLLAINEVEPNSLESALEYVHKQLGRAKGIRYFDKLLYGNSRQKTGLKFN